MGPRLPEAPGYPTPPPATVAAAAPEKPRLGRVLRLVQLSKVFRDAEGQPVNAVDHLNLQVEGGELVALCGPSGCGKTTTLRLVAGLEHPTHGEIHLDDQPLTRVPANRRNVGMVFQSYALFPHMRVFDNVAYPLQVRGEANETIQRSLREVLSLVDLEGLENRYPSQLSGGQQQRVALARALVMRPDLLLFDEPLSNLDAKLRVQVRGEIRRLQKTCGITALYVTHDQTEAMSISDRIAIMNLGVIEQVGPPREIYYHPANRFVADFLGKANFLPGRVLGHRDGTTIVRLDLETTLVVPGQASPDSRVEVVVRPECIRLRQDGPGLEGRVRAVEFQGSTVEYWVAVGSSQLYVTELSEARQAALSVDTLVRVEFALEHVHFLKT